MNRVFLSSCLTTVVLFAGVGTSHAQDSSWGVTGSIVPTWTVPSRLSPVLGNDVVVSGSDFSVGIVRGRALSGDWGVSFVRQSWKDGSHVGDVELDCQYANGCFQYGSSYATSQVTLRGVKIHKFVPFGTIKQRVQIGMNFAGGIGYVRGNVNNDEYGINTTFLNNQLIGQQTQDTTVLLARDKIASGLKLGGRLPLGDLQLAVAFLTMPGLKVRAAGGLNFPGTTSFSLTGVYFFGGN